MTPTPTQAKIHIERMMYRSSIAVVGESAASYALVKLIPAGGGDPAPPGLNIALVLDVSGSMYEEDGTGISRLKRIQQAATAAINKLNPSDSLAIIAFAHNAEVVLPATLLSEKSKIEDIIQRIDLFNVDPSAMNQAVRLSRWAIENLQDPKGFFHYQIQRWHRVRIPYIRWGQAWMQLALTKLVYGSSTGLCSDLALAARC